MWSVGDPLLAAAPRGSRDLSLTGKAGWGLRGLCESDAPERLGGVGLRGLYVLQNIGFVSGR